LKTYAAQFLTFLALKAWGTLADVFWRSCRLDTEASILTVMVLTDPTKVILNCSWHWSNLTESTGIASGTHTTVAVDSVFTCCTILTDMGSAVVYVLRTILACIATGTLTSIVNVQIDAFCHIDTRVEISTKYNLLFTKFPCIPR
jgi:hypothetical protein